MAVSRLSYLSIRALDLAASEKHYTEVIGLRVTGRSPGQVYLQAHEAQDHHCIILNASDRAGLDHVGFKVNDPNDLNEAEAGAKAWGLKTHRIAAGNIMGQGEGLGIELPSGHTFNLFYHSERVGYSYGMKDPDIILVGELRDLETIEAALTLAETGHLVFGTIHASSAPSTIGRILDLFPQGMHNALRSAIAMNMKGIIAQKLLKSIKPGVGRVPTVEIMKFSPTVRKLILEEEDHKLADAIRIGSEDGMQDFTQSLKKLVDDGLIDREVAMEVAPNREALKMALKGIEVKQPGIL